MATVNSKAPVGSDRAAQQMAAIEGRIDHLRRKFQMYFNGFDRVPPLTEYESLKRDVRELQQTGFATQQARFKAQNLTARFQVQRSMWDRELVRREEGLARPGQAAVKSHGPADRSPEPIDDL
jgi:ABC-type arginine transport system ATPase subunit